MVLSISSSFKQYNYESPSLLDHTIYVFVIVAESTLLAFVFFKSLKLLQISLLLSFPFPSPLFISISLRAE